MIDGIVGAMKLNDKVNLDYGNKNLQGMWSRVATIGV
jgi:hypothetical protein